MIRHLAWVACLCLGACDQSPRSAAFFEAHPAEAQAVFERCKRGAQRGEECRSAEAGLAKIENQALIDMFRRGIKK